MTKTLTVKQPRGQEFASFNHFLMERAPTGYRPHYFKCRQGGKDPARWAGAWKDPYNRLTPAEAIRWMRHRCGNIGIAGMPTDRLINVDIDDTSATQKSELKPTLMARSRSREGLHAWYFAADEIPNIPTEAEGEVRAQGQYVIAPGSFVPTDLDTVPEGERDNAGYYTLIERQSVSWLSFSQLPDVFIEAWEERQNRQERKPVDIDPEQLDGPHSALYDVTVADIVARKGGSMDPRERWNHWPGFHRRKPKSETNSNMSVSEDGQLVHCWRHNCAHNAQSALAVFSGYMTCTEAGFPHHGGASKFTGDDGAIFHGWRYAKDQGYIPKDDPIPVRAMHHIARKHGLYDAEHGEMLPTRVYNRVIEIVETGAW